RPSKPASARAVAGCASITVTVSPARASASASAGPFSPPPVTITSASYGMTSTIPARPGLSMRSPAATVLPEAAEARMAEWRQMSAGDLGRAIGRGEIGPEELTAAFLDAIRAHPLWDD